MSSMDLSRALGIREKDVLHHIDHVEKTLKARNQRIQIIPASCRSCGFVFAGRRRFSKPGRCPECRGTYLDSPLFYIPSP